MFIRNKKKERKKEEVITSINEHKTKPLLTGRIMNETHYSNGEQAR